jgi:hypothetical protein
MQKHERFALGLSCVLVLLSYRSCLVPAAYCTHGERASLSPLASQEVLITPVILVARFPRSTLTHASKLVGTIFHGYGANTKFHGTCACDLKVEGDASLMDIFNASPTCVPEHTLMFSLVYLMYVVWQLAIRGSRFHNPVHVILAPWRHMHTLSLIYAAAHWLSAPGVWFVNQAFGGEINLTEWTSEGLQLHPDILMYAGAVLGTWEWVNYLLNQTELTTVEYITSIAGVSGGYGMISNAAGATATSTFAKSVEAICKQLPHVPTMIWAMFSSTTTACSAQLTPKRCSRTSPCMVDLLSWRPHSHAASLYWKSQEYGKVGKEKQRHTLHHLGKRLSEI